MLRLDVLVEKEDDAAVGVGKEELLMTEVEGHGAETVEEKGGEGVLVFMAAAGDGLELGDVEGAGGGLGGVDEVVEEAARDAGGGEAVAVVADVEGGGGDGGVPPLGHAEGSA